MANLLLGLDVGTTATKALAFDRAGNVVASASCGYGLLTPEPDWVEQAPAAFCCAVAETTRPVLGQLAPGDRIAAMSQSSQGGTTIPVNADGRPTCNAISWMDQRMAEMSIASGDWDERRLDIAAFRGKETHLRPVPANVERYDEAFAAYQRGAGARQAGVWNVPRRHKENVMVSNNQPMQSHRTLQGGMI